MNNTHPFALFRIIFGSYLTIHFLHLVPYAGELWSNEGTVPDPTLNFTYGIFPNLLNRLDSPMFIQNFLLLLVLLSLLLTLGTGRRICSFLLWYGWACLLNRNNFISNPGIPYVGWLLLACTLIPAGEGLSPFSKKDDGWKMPAMLFTGAWLIMAVGYTISGIDKLFSPSWANGSAVTHLLNNPLARDWSFREFLLSLPELSRKILTWTVLIAEILFLPACIFLKGRLILWVLMIIIHIGILLIVDFADLTCAMLMIHLFTFDPRWLKLIPKPEISASSFSIK